jgi:hypothetical protein
MAGLADLEADMHARPHGERILFPQRVGRCRPAHRVDAQSLQFAEYPAGSPAILARQPQDQVQNFVGRARPARLTGAIFGFAVVAPRI